MENNRSKTTFKKRRNTPKNDLSFQQIDTINEEDESSSHSFSDNQEELINEDEFDNLDITDNKPVSKYQFYFEAIITIILCFHSYFIYSYLNIVHVVYIFLLTYTRYETDYNCLVKNKKTFMIVLIIIDSIYLILKSIFFVIFSINKSISNTLSDIYPFFLVDHNWKNYYEYVMVFIIIVLFIDSSSNF